MLESKDSRCGNLADDVVRESKKYNGSALLPKNLGKMAKQFGVTSRTVRNILRKDRKGRGKGGHHRANVVSPPARQRRMNAACVH